MIFYFHRNEMFGTRLSSFRVIFIIFLFYFATTVFFMMRLEKNYETGREIDAEDLVYFYDIVKDYRIATGKRENDDATLLKGFLSKMHNHTWKTWEIAHILHQMKMSSLNQARKKRDNSEEDDDASDERIVTRKPKVIRKKHVVNPDTTQETTTQSPVTEENILLEANMPTLPDAEYDPLPPDAPGENGTPIVINKDNLTAEERKKWDNGYKLYGYNSFVSDKVSVHRKLPDVRPENCTRVFRSDLPETSIITCFNNEAWSVLLRLVHSVLNNSPPHLVKEIILFDDHSDLEYLGKPLECYMSKLKKVRIIRAKERVGSIRARSLAMTEAKAPVLTVLDSHCEVFPGWLEPLLDRVAADGSLIISPTINVIVSDTFAVDGSPLWDLGGFDLERIEFKWIPVNYTKRNDGHPNYEPYKSPALGGGLMTMTKEFFLKTGKYDEEMEIWGPDNVELSLRTWMCGGSMEVHPCSHVGHVFRASSPFSWGGDVDKILLKNHVRVAEVWLDDYKRFYYGRIGYNLGDYGNVSARQQLRKDLKCHDFQWYIDNVYPELDIPPDSLAEGEIVHQNKTLCLDAMNWHAKGLPAAAVHCHGLGGLQSVRLTDKDDIRFMNGCLDYMAEAVVLTACAVKGSQKWKKTGDNIVHVESSMCLTIKTLGPNNLTLRKCSNEPTQVWKIVPAKKGA